MFASRRWRKRRVERALHFARVTNLATFQKAGIQGMELKWASGHLRTGAFPAIERLPG